MLLTFNELSAQTTTLNSQYDAQQLIDEFADFCKKLNETNSIDDIIFPSDIYSTSIYDGYGIFQWLYDRNVSQKHRQFLKRFLDKYKNTFDKNDQERLADYLKQECDCFFMLIIKNTDFILSLYENSVDKHGRKIKISKFDKKYLVSFQNRNNKEAEHLIITNY